MNPATVKLALAVALLALATSGSLAEENCPFEFSQSANTTQTLIKVAGKIAIIETGSHSAWKGYVKAAQYSDDDPVTVVDQTGETSSKQYSELPEEEKSLINLIQFEPMTGIKVSVSSGGGYLHYEPTSENALITTYNVRGTAKISGLRENVFAFAKKSAQPYTHVFYQFGSVVTLVDNDCKNVTIVPFDKISSELEKFLVSQNFEAPTRNW